MDQPVVMATEQGNKAVDSGGRGIAFGRSIEIRALADSVPESAQAASLIDLSVEQQFVGWLSGQSNDGHRDDH